MDRSPGLTPGLPLCGEYAFTNFLTGFAEYDYYDFGTRGRCGGDLRPGRV